MSSRRFLAAALLLVLGSTLYPFGLDSSGDLPGHEEALVNAYEERAGGLADLLGNILLFVPLGFALAGSSLTGAPMQRAVLVTAMVCLALSLGVEALQVILPSRSSAMFDVLMNTLGGILGMLLNRFLKLRYLKTPGPRAATLLALVSLLWSMSLLSVAPFALRSGNLCNWDGQFPLLLGNEDTGNRPWSGRLSLLQIANRAVNDAEAAQIAAAGGDLVAIGQDPVVSLRFRAGSLSDESGCLPALIERGRAEGGRGQADIRLGGGRWLGTGNAASALTSALQRTGRLTLSAVVFNDDSSQSGPARIVSLSGDPLNRNFTLAQKGPNLVFRLRTPFTGNNGNPPQLEAPGVFGTSRSRKLLLTFDGSSLRLYVDGTRNGSGLELPEPNVGMRCLYYWLPLEVASVSACQAAFYFLVLVPLGFALRRLANDSQRRRLKQFAFILLPALLLEAYLLVLESEGFAPADILLGVLATGCGILLAEPRE